MSTLVPRAFAAALAGAIIYAIYDAVTTRLNATHAVIIVLSTLGAVIALLLPHLTQTRDQT